MAFARYWKARCAFTVPLPGPRVRARSTSSEHRFMDVEVHRCLTSEGGVVHRALADRLSHRRRVRHDVFVHPIALGRTTSPKPQIIAALIAIALSAACTGTRSEIQPSV